MRFPSFSLETTGVANIFSKNEILTKFRSISMSWGLDIFRQPPGSVGVSISCFCKALVHVENFAPFTRVFRSTITTLRQSVESIVFNHLAHLYSLVTAVVQELLSKTWKRTLDFMLVYIRYDWLLLGDNQKKVNQFLQLKCLLSHKIQTCTAPEMIPTPKWYRPRNDPDFSSRRPRNDPLLILGMECTTL